MGAGASARRRKQFAAGQAALAAVRITAFFRARAVRLRAWEEVEVRLRNAIAEWKASRDSRSSVRTAVGQAAAVRLPEANAVLQEARQILRQQPAAEEDEVALHQRRLQAEADDAEMALLVQQLKEQDMELQRGSEVLASLSFGAPPCSLQAETATGISLQEARCLCGHPFRQWKVPIVGYFSCYSSGAQPALKSSSSSSSSSVQSAQIPEGTASAEVGTWESLEEGAGGLHLEANDQTPPHTKADVKCPSGHQLIAFRPSAVQPQPAGYPAGKAVVCARCSDVQKPLQNEEIWQRCSTCAYDICTPCAIAKRGQQAFDNDPDTFPPESFSLCFRAAALSAAERE